MDELVKYRLEIEDIDKNIALLLNRRMELSKCIGNYKKINNLPVFDSEREKFLLEKNSKFISPENVECYKKIFETILKCSKDMQL